MDLLSIRRNLTEPRSWIWVVSLIVAYGICVALFAWRYEAMKEIARKDPGPVPDARFWTVEREIGPYFKAIGPKGQDLYIKTQLTLDTAFPLIYGALIVALAAWWCYPGLVDTCVYLSVLMVLLDFVENGLLVAIAHYYGEAAGLIPWAALFIRLKWIVGLVTLVLLGRAGFRRLAEYFWP
jgi:hypothetical protein